MQPSFLPLVSLSQLRYTRKIFLNEVPGNFVREGKAIWNVRRIVHPSYKSYKHTCNTSLIFVQEQSPGKKHKGYVSAIYQI